jgi:peptide/nickel transport system substrate-binding protein
LRHGVRFHDGSEFSAEDVIWSMDRPAKLINSPSPFTMYSRSMVEKIMVDRYTVRFRTAAPYALLLNDLSNLYIVSKKATAGLSPDDLNAGRGMIGTGPYKFVQFKRGDRLELARNENFYGARPEWDRVSLRIFTNPQARVAALLAGDVQMIEAVPPPDIGRIKARADLSVPVAVSSRLIYLVPDTGRDKSPFIADKAGNPLAKNPLRDLRVRQAISKAISRSAMVDKIMEGNAVVASQFVPDGFWGASAKLKVDGFDIDGAKKLMADAGYPDGFAITLHGTNDRYVNDTKVLQTVAQMLNRIGIVAKVDSMPAAVFFSRQNKNEFSMSMTGWGGGAGLPFSYLKGLVATYNANTGYGVNNDGRYSNAKVDALTEQAFLTLDLPKQEKLWQQATELAIGELAVIPLHHQVNVWALRKGYRYVPRSDEFTLAQEVHSSAGSGK